MEEESIRRVMTPAGDPAWLVTGYDTVKALLADPRLGRSHPEPQRASRYSESVMFGQAAAGTPETERVEHAWMRKLLTPSFSARRMAVLQPKVEDLADGLLQRMARGRPPADFHEAVSFPLPVLVICELLGVPYQDREDFRRWSDDAAAMTDASRSSAGLARLQEYMRALLERKRRQPAADVLSDLAAAQVQLQGAFTDEHAATLAGGLLFAGHETTVTAIDRGVLLLLTNPEQRAALERDPESVERAVEEILRHPGPGPTPRRGRQADGVPRWANSDLEVGGLRVPAGDLVLLALHEANMDERQFADPGEFDVTRRENLHLTFGHGPHFCVGAPLARVELRAAFRRLFQRLPGLRLAKPVEELRPRRELLTGGVAELPVAW